VIEDQLNTQELNCLVPYGSVLQYFVFDTELNW